MGPAACLEKNNTENNICMDNSTTTFLKYIY